jgi:HK97 family phage prohead protease
MQISRKECEKFKMAINFDYDFSGWATKANVKCFDGLTIAPNAFKECDGQVVPVVWNHDHSAPESVLGHALLQNRKEGVYAYVKLNDTSSGQTAKACVNNGDIDAMSIYANGIQKAGRTVMHGMIKELSLVIAGCNPGALIDEVVKHSADGTETDSSEAYIYTDSGLSLKHGLDPDDNPLEDETLQHSDDSSETDKDEKGESKMADVNEKTVKEVFDTLTDEQKNVVYAIIGSALDEGKGGESNDEGDGEEDNTMHHCFENDNGGTVLQHSIDDINGIIATASKHGTLRDAFLDAGITGDELAHSIENMDYLFPDDHNLDTVPRIVDRDQT